MQNAKVCPVMMLNESSHHESERALHEDASWCRRGPDFWYARRAFLNSYHLTTFEPNNNNHMHINMVHFNFIKHKLNKSVKHVNHKAIALVWDLRRGFSNTRLAIKPFRLTISFPSLLLVNFRCCVPCFNKTNKDIM